MGQTVFAMVPPESRWMRAVDQRMALREEVRGFHGDSELIRDHLLLV